MRVEARCPQGRIAPDKTVGSGDEDDEEYSDGAHPLYHLAFIAMRARLYVLALFLLKHALLRAEPEYVALMSRPSMLLATLWLLQQVNARLCAALRCGGKSEAH